VVRSNIRNSGLMCSHLRAAKKTINGDYLDMLEPFSDRTW